MLPFKQRGLTLVELLIAMVVSLVLVAGVATVYISSQRTYHARDQLSGMDETARVALDTLTKNLEHAGYATPAKLPIGDYFYYKGASTPVAYACGDGKNNIRSVSGLTSKATQDAFNSNGDSIAIRFIGDSALNTDCANASLTEGCQIDNASTTAASFVYNEFYVATDSSGIPNNLYCMASNDPNPKPITRGIENIQFLYGLDSDRDGAVNTYLKASSLTASDWAHVISIQVAILVRSQETVYDVDTAKSYTLLDTTVTRNDRYQRAVYATVIQLRNVIAS